jgi:hypothetical protein
MPPSMAARWYLLAGVEVNQPTAGDPVLQLTAEALVARCWAQIWAADTRQRRVEGLELQVFFLASLKSSVLSW